MNPYPFHQLMAMLTSPYWTVGLSRNGYFFLMRIHGDYRHKGN